MKTIKFSELKQIITEADADEDDISRFGISTEFLAEYLCLKLAIAGYAPDIQEVIDNEVIKDSFRGKSYSYVKSNFTLKFDHPFPYMYGFVNKNKYGQYVSYDDSEPFIKCKTYFRNSTDFADDCAGWPIDTIKVKLSEYRYPAPDDYEDPVFGVYFMDSATEKQCFGYLQIEDGGKEKLADCIINYIWHSQELAEKYHVQTKRNQTTKEILDKHPELKYKG